MDIPAHIQTALAVGSPIEEPALLAAATASSIPQTVFGLTAQDFTTAVIDGLGRSVVYTVSQPAQVPRSWKYLEMSNGGTLELLAVFTPSDTTRMPATSASQMLVQAWLTNPLVIQGDCVCPNMLVGGLASGGGLSSFTTRFIEEWSIACAWLETASFPPSWVSKSQFGIAANARLTSALLPNLKYKELLLEAIAEYRSKWRFLSLYRVLEHGYLSEIFQALSNAFFSSPKESLAAGLKSLENEIAQFQTLVQNVSLQTQFEALYDLYDAAKAGGNQFAFAVERSIQHGGQQNLTQDKWRKGVLVCYKIRCAIVHAGLSAPIFDAYPDARGLIDILLPTCESITLTFLGITII